MTDKQKKMRALGRQGGLATARKYGSAYMASIGRRGFQAALKTHWNGDKAAFGLWLSRMGLEAQDPFPENGAWQWKQRDGEPW